MIERESPTYRYLSSQVDDCPVLANVAILPPGLDVSALRGEASAAFWTVGGHDCSLMRRKQGAEMAGIVMLDMKGYSSLPRDGARAVFENILPAIDGCLSDLDPPLDINTWGDGVIAIFQNITDAARFAINVRTIFEREEFAPHLQILQVRIVIHQGDLHRGRDPLRARSNGAAGTHHYYGREIVIPARLEPKTPPNNIVVTEAAYQAIHNWLQDYGKATLQDWEDHDELKGVSRKVKTYLLVPKGASRPILEKKESPLDPLQVQLQIESLRQLAELAEQYRLTDLVAFSSRTLAKGFQRTFYNQWLDRAIQCLLLPEPENIQVDVLILSKSKSRKRVLVLRAATDKNRERTIPPMEIPPATVECPPQQGVAAYIVHAIEYRNKGRVDKSPGIGIVGNTYSDRNMIYCERKRELDEKTSVVVYRQELVENMYKPSVPGKAGKGPGEPYTSLLTVPIMHTVPVTSTSGSPGTEVRLRCDGVLNITTKNQHQFRQHEMLWAETAGQLIGSMFGFFHETRERMRNPRPRKNGTKKPPRRFNPKNR